MPNTADSRITGACTRRAAVMLTYDLTEYHEGLEAILAEVKTADEWIALVAAMTAIASQLVRKLDEQLPGLAQETVLPFLRRVTTAAALVEEGMETI